MNEQYTRPIQARCCPENDSAEGALSAVAAATVSAGLKGSLFRRLNGSQFGQFAPVGNTPPCRLDRRRFTLPS